MVFFIITASAFLQGQTDLDAVRPFTGLGGPGSRAGGLGLAFTGIADDATALYYNPAGLAHLTRGEINLGLTYLSIATDVSAQGASSTATITATRLGNLGFAFPISDVKLTLALGYHQVRTFKRQQDRTFEKIFDDTLFTVREHLSEEGGLGAFSLGFGYQISPQLALGSAVDIISGNNDYTENDTFTTQSGINYVDIFNIKSTYIGIGFTLGILMAPIPQWRIGMLLRSPQWIKVNDELDEMYSEIIEVRDYSTRCSYSYRFGSSLSFGPITFIGDLFWFDYSQIRFKSEIYDTTLVPGSNIHIDILVNDSLRTQYASALGYATGAELLLPGINAKLRGGYRSDPPINRNSLAKETRHTFALGLGVVPVPQIRIDTTYSITTWQRDLSSGVSEETSASMAMVNLVYRF